jgi:hypothetical protein
MDFDKLHSIKGHPNNAFLKETAKFNNIQLTSVHNQPCPHPEWIPHLHSFGEYHTEALQQQTINQKWQ